jgi:hypothetical protein
LEENHEDCLDSTGLENFVVATMKMESKERAFIVLPIAWGTVGTVEST